MSIKFREIKKYLARDVRLSICFEDGHYHDYLMISDIPENRYDNLYVYGIGICDVEFSMDVYRKPQDLDGEVSAIKDDTIEPAIEIVLFNNPRKIERSRDEIFLLKDLKPYLQIEIFFSVVNRENWNNEEYECRNEIPEKYDDMYVYGIGMEDNPNADKLLENFTHGTYLKKQMVIVISDKPRLDIKDEFVGTENDIEI